MRYVYIKFHKICIKPPVIYWYFFLWISTIIMMDAGAHTYIGCTLHNAHGSCATYFLVPQFSNWLQYFHGSIALYHTTLLYFFFSLFIIARAISCEHNYYYNERKDIFGLGAIVDQIDHH